MTRPAWGALAFALMAAVMLMSDWIRDDVPMSAGQVLSMHGLVPGERAMPLVRELGKPVRTVEGVQMFDWGCVELTNHSNEIGHVPYPLEGTWDDPTARLATIRSRTLEIDGKVALREGDPAERVTRLLGPPRRHNPMCYRLGGSLLAVDIRAGKVLSLEMYLRGWEPPHFLKGDE